MAALAFTVNGEPRTVDTDPDRPLLDVLREDLGLTGAKYGCGEGSCRSCTVLIDGRPRAACTYPIRRAEGQAITTIEGLASDGPLHPLQEAFIAEHAMQCGYCVPGMILTAVSLLETNPNPSSAEIIEWMNGNLCRCGNYVNLVRAIERAAVANREATA